MKGYVLTSSVVVTAAFVMLSGFAVTSCAGVPQQATRPAGSDALVGTWRLVDSESIPF
jgi:hypothetical protein